MVEKKESLSLSSHSKRSAHGKDEFMSVTVRKDDPKEKAGIRLEAEANGRIRVVNIAKNGLFGDSEVSIGDIVLSVNGKRIAKGEGPETLVEVIAKAKSKVTMVVKKTDVAPRVPEKVAKDMSVVKDNNVKQEDNFYEGQSKFKKDGSIALTTTDDIKKKKKKKKKITSCTISANKEDVDGEKIDDSAGLSFVVQNKALYVSRIDQTSVFGQTDLEVGDRVLSINDCNFRAYADALFASKMIAKAQNAVTVVVEKGGKKFKPVPESELATTASKVPTRRRSSRSTSRDGKSKRKSKVDEKKPVRRMLKSSAATSDNETSETISDGEDSFGNDGIGELAGLPSNSKSYDEVVIAAPKQFASQEVGVLFETKKNRHIVVKTIQEGSIFSNTSLQPGDIILEINDVNYRTNCDKLHAWKTCKKTKETVTMLVLREKAKTYKQQEFNLDSSVTNLEWQVA